MTKIYVVMGNVDADSDENRNIAFVAYQDEAEASRIVTRLNELKVWKKSTYVRDENQRVIYERGHPKTVEPVYEQDDPEARKVTLIKALNDLIPCPHDDEGDWGDWIGFSIIYMSFSIDTVTLR